MPLELQANFHEPGTRSFRDFSPGDDFYELLIAMHHGLSDEQSASVNARLILILSNHIGDISILKEAMHVARTGVEPAAPSVA